MTDEFKAKPGTAVHMPMLSEALINFAFNQAQEFVDSGQSVREATSICANLLLDAAWKVAGAGAAADGFDPNKDKFRARVEDVLERVNFSKMGDGEVSCDQPSANPETPPPSTHLRGRWRVFEDTTPGYWGIELEDAGNDDEAVMSPIKIHRDTVARIVEAHNAVLATTEGQDNG